MTNYMWALNNHRNISKQTILLIYSDIINVIREGKPGSVVSNKTDAYALASKFEGVIYRYPYFRRKHIRVLYAIIDRCGDAYLKREPLELYISKEVLKEWGESMRIELGKLLEYLSPLQQLNVLQRSDKPGYEYRISEEFFRLVGPIAARGTDLHGVAGALNGLTSVYAVANGVRLNINMPTIPSFLRVAMALTLSELNEATYQKAVINRVLSTARINEVGRYFVEHRKYPRELWRSVKEEALDFMDKNKIIEGYVGDGYELNTLWVRAHEAGVVRYIHLEVERWRFQRGIRGWW
ncbi:MAG: hypothetical protein QW290_08020 [Sulfolobales archaeon]